MDDTDGRLLAMLSLNLAVLEFLERHPTRDSARRIEDIMFLPRSVEKIERYLGDRTYPELRECMFLTDLSDKPEVLVQDVRRIGALLKTRLDRLLNEAKARTLIFDWLP